MKPKLRFTTLFSHTAKEKFEDIKSTTAILDACLVKGNSKYTALSWHSSGGGALAVLDINKPSRLPHNFPMIRGHSGVVMDFDFYPFNDNIIITASEDASLRLWNIPSEFTEDLTQHIAKLAGHAKKVNLVQFHPSAQSIVASASFDYSVRVWNVESQSSVCQIKGAQESFMALEWNRDGSQILTSCRDKTVRIGDPRSGAWEMEFRGHEGPKTQKSLWLGQGYVMTVGFSKNFGREMYVWNVANLKDPVQTMTIDQAAGTLYPFYDEDCRVLYLAGKGDGNIRYYEFAEGQLYNLTQHTSTVPQKGIGFLPKRCVDVTQNELMRCLKLTTNTLEFVSFNAMRKSESFQEDLYPPCVSGEPAIKAEEWTHGKNHEPKRRSMDPESSGNVKTGGAAAINVTGAPVSQTKASAPVQQAAVQSSGDSASQGRVNALQAELEAAKQELEELANAKNVLLDQNENIRSELWAKDQENNQLRARLANMRAVLEQREAKRAALARAEEQFLQNTHQQETYEQQNEEQQQQTQEIISNLQDEYGGYTYNQQAQENQEIQGETNYEAQYGQHGQHHAQLVEPGHTRKENTEDEFEK